MSSVRSNEPAMQGPFAGDEHLRAERTTGRRRALWAATAKFGDRYRPSGAALGTGEKSAPTVADFQQRIEASALKWSGRLFEALQRFHRRYQPDGGRFRRRWRDRFDLNASSLALSTASGTGYNAIHLAEDRWAHSPGTLCIYPTAFVLRSVRTRRRARG